MWLLILTTVYAAYAAEISVPIGEEVENHRIEKLKWPETYSFKAIKLSLTSDIEETLTVWKTHDSSRVDYNGVVTEIKKKVSGKNDTHYLIRPETRLPNTYNEIVCHNYNSTIKLDVMLPLAETEYRAVCNESIDEIETTKFELKFNTTILNFSRYVHRTIWAKYVDDIGWFPVRYDDKVYYNASGAICYHITWTFSDFKLYVDDNAFDEDQFHCNRSVIHSEDSDAVTKELMFINADDEEHVHHVFNRFRNKFNRDYADAEEHKLRKSIFVENMRQIAQFNRQNASYKLGVNQFSDRTPEELQKSYGLIPSLEQHAAVFYDRYDKSVIDKIVKRLPTDYDMRLFGLVSPVKDQDSCYSCWAFAATAVTESTLAKAMGGPVISLSTQALVDCVYPSDSETTGGCTTGSDHNAYQFIRKYGLPTEKDYGPYKDHEDFCRLKNINTTFIYKINDYKIVPSDNTNAIKVVLYEKGPVSFPFNTTRKLSLYTSGIFRQTREDCEHVDGLHGMVMVGYGEKDGEIFWIVKNSWGVHWGMDGYMLLAARNNYCGIIKDQISYVEV